MSINSKLSKLFFRKDRNIALSLLIGFLVIIFVFLIEINQGFLEFERYIQALIYHIGYKLPKDTKLVTVVKKDKTTESLLNIDPNNRHIHASFFNFLGQRQKRESIFKSRSRTFELLILKIGLYEKIRNQKPITTSWDEWNDFIVEKENKNSNIIDYSDQDKWNWNSKQVINYFKKPENKDKPGFTSFIKVTGNTWKPSGINIFKVLAGGSKYLIFPTFCVDWNSKEVKEEIKSFIDDFNDDNDNVEKRKKDNNVENKQNVKEILTRWQNLFNNLQYAEVEYEFKLQ